MVDVPFDTVAGVPPAEVGEVELYHPRSWWTRYVFSQDAKVIAIQYSITAMSIGMVALVLSWLMRLQLGFPGTFSFIDPNQYLQLITMHGMIMVIYLLTVSGRFWKLPHPADGRRPGHGFPLCQHAELLGVCTENPVRVY
jgi:cytochrome c oxidase subunit 1